MQTPSQAQYLQEDHLWLNTIVNSIICQNLRRQENQILHIQEDAILISQGRTNENCRWQIDRLGFKVQDNYFEKSQSWLFEWRMQHAWGKSTYKIGFLESNCVRSPNFPPATGPTSPGNANKYLFFLCPFFTISFPLHLRTAVT